MTKLKNSNCDKTKKKVNFTKIKNSNCDKTQKLKLWQESKIQIVTKLKKSNCDNMKKSDFDKTQKLKLWQSWGCFTITSVIKYFIYSLSNWVSQPLVKISSKHSQSPTGRARELQFWETVHPSICVMCQMLPVTCHVSPVTCHM